MKSAKTVQQKIFLKNAQHVYNKCYELHSRAIKNIREQF